VSEADVPIRETCPLKPASPYAVSKVGEDMLGLQYWAFLSDQNHPHAHVHAYGGARGDVLPCPSSAKQIAAAEQGLKEPGVINVGILSQ